MKKKTKLIFCLCLAAALLAGVGVYAVTAYGTKSDPLVTLSYLNDKLSPDLLEDVQMEIDTQSAALESKLDASLASKGGSYVVLTLTKGQKLTGSVGCEILLRIGSCKASGADEPVLVDVTDGSNLKNGSALTTNHLYMVTIAGNGITATAATTKVLVRGSYTLS